LDTEGGGQLQSFFNEHLTIAAQMEDVDAEILDNLIQVSENQVYTEGEKQQIKGVTLSFTFSEGNQHVKAGTFKKEFTFDDEKEVLVCVPSKTLPFKSADFVAKNGDSFFVSWFTSEGVDDGILAAQDAISSELYVDPLKLYALRPERSPRITIVLLLHSLM
jgi:hypothetical protein